MTVVLVGSFVLQVVSYQTTLSIAPWIFLINTLLVNALLIRQAKNSKEKLLSPSFLINTYVGFSFTLGAWLLKYNIIDLFWYTHGGYSRYYTIEGLGLVINYFVLCQVAICIAGSSKILLPSLREGKLRVVQRGRNFMRPMFGGHMASCVLGVGLVGAVLSLVILNSSVASLAGTLARYSLQASLIVTLVGVYNKKHIFRWIVYFVVLYSIAVVSPSSRRNIVVVILAVLFVEMGRSDKNRDTISSFPKYGVIIGFSLFVFYLATTMRSGFSWNIVLDSSLQGYLSIIAYYVEGYATYFHSVEAVHLVNTGQVDLSYGATFYRSLTAPIPDDYITTPPTHTDKYMKISYPHSLNKGHTKPPNLLAEMYINFHFVGSLFVGATVYFAELVYVFIKKAKNSVTLFSLLLAIYLYLPVLVRGSGTSNFLAYVVFVSIIMVILFTISRVLNIVKLSVR
jgi:hypothetical protein